MKEDEIKKAVRDGYARTVSQGSSCCGGGAPCCGSTDMAQTISRSIGYADEELQSVPQGANLGLGCGNPQAGGQQPDLFLAASEADGDAGAAAEDEHLFIWSEHLLDFGDGFLFCFDHAKPSLPGWAPIP